MKIIDLIEESRVALLSNKARTGLTMLGIIIGIASVIAMISLGEGAQKTIETSIQSLGSNLLTIYPGVQQGPGAMVSAGRGSSQTLTNEDSEAIAKLDLVQNIAPVFSARYQITARGTNTNTNVIATTSEYSLVRNIEIAQGAFLTDQNNRAFAKVAILGPTTSADLFGEGVNPLGQKIRINQVEFTVTGITKEEGGAGFFSLDDIIYIPLSTAQQYLEDELYLSSINVSAADEESMDVLEEQIINLLLKRHNISSPELADFSIMNQADIVATATEVTQTFTIFLGAVAAISLLVGGIGIMNMMLTTVTERTREIGLRKAIGAKESDINRQFLLEAVILTFIGGLIGIILGFVIAKVVSNFAGYPTSITLSSIVLAFGVATGIGIVFGYYPAWRAAKLDPIQALRYE